MMMRRPYISSVPLVRRPSGPGWGCAWTSRGQEAAGNSNDGNTARRAFRSPAEFAAGTGVDQELIDRVGTVLQAVSCLHRLDIDALSAYCRRTAELYVERYMSSTLHKLLSHSAAVVESCHLPIGTMHHNKVQTKF
ncbi:hypothetical protein FJT64_012060 [Amphibalanus amphitrite]|uniref:Uncharacterized protein n=1 Tax=Amphibalanus amphitrite TaxID=1232801 RepID=A0A6A4V7R7_AMPAM|nr:hypothetical protein FJT64_012060 [Amphibalanus amphitrite]